jgi:hypothetical protein
MLRGKRSPEETRFDLFTWGAILISAAILYLLFKDTLPSVMVFIPGLILLGSTIFQDLQDDWHAGWLNYAMAILAVGTGLAGIVNDLVGGAEISWIIVAIVEFGAILIVKALYDPSPDDVPNS